ncbi:MAG: FAD-binding oxidoreductase [Thermodesulfobacteriota bacterium]
MTLKPSYDVVIIGCGIAGASLAYFLADSGLTDILILEKEEQPGYHATGRSAGVLMEFDLVPTTLHLTQHGGRFLRNPPPGFSENPILNQSGILLMFQGELWDLARGMVPELNRGGTRTVELSPQEVAARIPVVLDRGFDGALLLPEGGHLDVHELLWSYLRQARRSGTQIKCGEEVRAVTMKNGRAAGVVTDRGEYSARWVVDAAGAWAGRVRELVGPSPAVIQPYLRTVITFAAPEGLDVKKWPFCANMTHPLYFSPESSGLLASPMDQDPVEPGDARPDELGVAITIERLKEVAPTLVPKALQRKWAGLRTFAPDQAMVVGEDPEIKGFFWLAGQGGSGIESSPAVGRLAADLILKGQTGLMDPRPMSPARFTG